MRISNAVSAVLFVLAGFVPAFAEFGPVEYFDFTGWNQAMISSPGGQDFMDVFEDLDVNVEGIGIFEEPTSATGTLIKVQHPNPTQNGLRFVFSEPLRMVIATENVDRNEIQSIFTASTERYMNTYGAEPTVTNVGMGISIQGTAVRIGPDGAAYGQTLTGVADAVTLSYDTLSLNKFGFWRVGILIPEPNSVALLGVGGLGLLMQFRKRK